MQYEYWQTINIIDEVLEPKISDCGIWFSCGRREKKKLMNDSVVNQYPFGYYPQICTVYPQICMRFFYPRLRLHYFHINLLPGFSQLVFCEAELVENVNLDMDWGVDSLGPLADFFFHFHLNQQKCQSTPPVWFSSQTWMLLFLFNFEIKQMVLS